MNAIAKAHFFSFALTRNSKIWKISLRSWKRTLNHNISVVTIFYRMQRVQPDCRSIWLLQIHRNQTRHSHLYDRDYILYHVLVTCVRDHYLFVKFPKFRNYQFIVICYVVIISTSSTIIYQSNTKHLIWHIQIKISIRKIQL